MSESPDNRYEYILRYGMHQQDPDVADTMYRATDAAPGSREKIEIMAKRFENGQPLFHPADRVDFSGLRMKLIPLESD